MKASHAHRYAETRMELIAMLSNLQMEKPVACTPPFSNEDPDLGRLA